MIDPIIELGVQSLAKSDPAKAANFLIERRDLAQARFEPYLRFVSKIGFTVEPRLFQIRSTSVGCAPLNSAWRSSSDSDRGNLFVGATQVTEAAERIRGADVRVILFHHPIEWLHDTDVRQLSILLSKWFHIACCGHRHSVESRVYSDSSGQVYYSVAKAIDGEKLDLGFSVLQIDPKGGLSAEHYRWEERRQEYAPDTELDDSGKHTIGQLPFGPIQGDMVRIQQESTRAATRAAQVATQRIARLAPKLAESGIFSHFDPPLQRADRIGRLGLRQIAASTQHWMITGAPLSGKTTTLQLLHDWIANSGTSSRMLNATDLVSPGVPDFVDAMRNVLSISGNKIRDLVSRKLIVLIDNFSATDPSFHEQLGLLQKWSQAYPNLQLIISVQRLPLTAQDSRSDLGPQWQRAELQPIALEDICILAEKCQDAGLLKTDGAVTVRNLITETFQGELPRHPWVVLLFMELCCTGERATGVSLASLLERYTEIQLNRMETDRTPLSSDVGEQGLMLMAARLFETSRPEMPIQELEELLASEFKRAALADEPGDAVSSLCRVGIIQASGTSVSFTLPALLDFFYAKYILYSGQATPSRLTPQELRQQGGALAIVSALRRGSNLASVAFETARLVAPSAATSISFETLTLDSFALSEAAFDAIDDSAAKHEALNDGLTSLEEGRSGSHAARLSSRENPEKTIEFLECYMAALGILRSSAFADGDTKASCVSAAIDLTMSVSEVFQRLLPALERTQTIWVEAEHIPKSERAKALSMLTVVMFIISNTVLGMAGGSQHLEQTLVRCFQSESDEARALTALMWLSLVSPARAPALTEQFIQRRVTHACLNILSMWLMAQYLFHSVMERRKDARWREAFRRAARAVAERVASRKDNNAINNATERVMRSVERQIDVADAKSMAFD